MAKQQKQRPEKIFKVGFVSASVFVNTSEREEAGEVVEREFRTVSVSRSYLDDRGKWQYTTGLSLGDLPNAIRVLQLAQAHIEAQEAEVAG